MKSPILATCAIFLTLNAFPQDRTGTVEFNTTRKGHTAKVSFTVGKFDQSAHKITGLDPCEDFTAVRIDGQYPFGTDCTMLKWEIKVMSFYFDEVNIEIPKKLYSDCYHPPFHLPEDQISRFFALRISMSLS